MMLIAIRAEYNTNRKSENWTCMYNITYSDGQKLTKKLPTKSLTNFFSWTNSLTKKLL